MESVGFKGKTKVRYRVMTLGKFMEGVRVNEEKRGPRTEPWSFQGLESCVGAAQRKKDW